MSAQCTDERVNQVTPALFAKYPDPAAMAAADPREVERMIVTTGFFRQKTKSLMAARRISSSASATGFPTRWKIS